MALSKNVKLEILVEQDFKCKGCGRQVTLEARRLRDWKKVLGYYPDVTIPSKAYFHHIKPQAKNGSDNPSNILATCGRCHAKTHGYYWRYK